MTFCFQQTQQSLSSSFMHFTTSLNYFLLSSFFFLLSLLPLYFLPCLFFCKLRFFTFFSTTNSLAWFGTGTEKENLFCGQLSLFLFLFEEKSTSEFFVLPRFLFSCLSSFLFLFFFFVSLLFLYFYSFSLLFLLSFFSFLKTWNHSPFW